MKSQRTMITTTKEFDPSKFVFREPKLNRHNGKVVYVQYGGGRRLLLQTPRLHLPFGASSFQDMNKWNLELSLKGYDEEGSDVHSFYEKLTSLDEEIMNQADKNCQKWFSRREPYLREVLKEKYTPLVRFNMNRETMEVDTTYPPKFKVRMYHKRGSESEFDVDCYDLEHQQIELTNDNIEEYLSAGCHLRAILAPTMIWFASGKFGLGWKAVQILVEPKQELKGCQIVPEEDEFDEVTLDAQLDGPSFVEQ